MNKPVAWMCKSGLEYQQVKEDFSYKEKEGWIPLYTHQLELTDEEIINTFVEETGFLFNDNPADGMDLMGFARAILRKAQEK